MEPDKDTSTDNASEPPKDEPKQEESTATEAPTPAASGESKDDGQAPADALSRTPDDLEKEEADQAAANPSAHPEEPEKKVSPIKRFFRKVNVYFLIFLLLLVVVGIIAAVNYLNSTKAPVTPNIASQTLTQSALQQLANTNTAVGATSQTLTIQGNAVISGQTLTRGNLNVAGTLQTAGSIQGASLTVSGAANLGATQINSLQVATNTAIQGTTTVHDLDVAGTASFGGVLTAAQITVTNLILSGNAILQIPNHLAFTGPSPSHTITTATLGNGGSASVNGSDTSGTININTGNNPVAGCFVHVSFQQAYTAQPHVIVSPIDSGAGQTQFYVTRDTSGFSVCTANAAPGNQVFAYDYFVAG